MLGKIEGRRRTGQEDEMAGWHHRLNAHEFGWTLGAGDGQGGPACCGPWGHALVTCRTLSSSLWSVTGNILTDRNWIWDLSSTQITQNKSGSRISPQRKFRILLAETSWDYLLVDISHGILLKCSPERHVIWFHRQLESLWWLVLAPDTSKFPLNGLPDFQYFNLLNG